MKRSSDSCRFEGLYDLEMKDLQVVIVRHCWAIVILKPYPVYTPLLSGDYQPKHPETVLDNTAIRVYQAFPFISKDSVFGVKMA